MVNAFWGQLNDLWISADPEIGSKCTFVLDWGFFWLTPSGAKFRTNFWGKIFLAVSLIYCNRLKKYCSLNTHKGIPQLVLEEHKNLNFRTHHTEQPIIWFFAMSSCKTKVDKSMQEFWLAFESKKTPKFKHNEDFSISAIQYKMLTTLKSTRWENGETQLQLKLR